MADGMLNSALYGLLGAGIAMFIAALAAYGFVATLQEESNFGRVLAAYGGIFVAGSLVWGIALDGFQPDRWDYTGATICLIGVAVADTADPARWAAATSPSDSATLPVTLR